MYRYSMQRWCRMGRRHAGERSDQPLHRTTLLSARRDRDRLRSSAPTTARRGGMASNDALGLLSAALSAPDLTTESHNLAQLFQLFQSQPGNIPIILPSLVSLVPRAKPSLVKWIADVLDLAFCRSTFSSEGRAALSIHTPDAILSLINDTDPANIKKGIQIFASVYAPLFRHCAHDPSSQRIWQTVEHIKANVARLHEQTGRQGIKIAAIKASQKIIQVQTRAGGDPRSRNPDVSISIVPGNHLFLHPQQLEQEASQLLMQLIKLVFTSSNADLVMASLNSLTLLPKARPSLTKPVIEALVNWTPAALAALPHTHVRNVEKTLRLVFWHFNRHGLSGSHEGQVSAALQAQKARMEAAARAHWEKREEESKRKREALRTATQQDNKRPRTDGPAPEDASTGSQLGGIAGALAFCQAAADEARPNPLATFDVTTLPLPLVIDLILANLSVLPDEMMKQAIDRTRARLHAIQPTGSVQADPTTAHVITHHEQQQHHSATLRASVKVEETEPNAAGQLAHTDAIQNPLKQDMEDEDLRHLEERQAMPGSAASGGAEEEEEEEEARDALAGLEDFELAPPEPFSQTEARALIKESVSRMCEQGGQAAANSYDIGDAIPPQTLWASLVTRLASRGFDIDETPTSEGTESEHSQIIAKPSGNSLRNQADGIRQMMLEFLSADFARRIPFAIQWLSEEWHCDKKRNSQKGGRGLSNYSIWLPRIVAAVLPTIGEKDRTLFLFLSELPSLPDEVVDQVASLCQEKTLMAVGLTGLREFAVSRPPVRERALSVLLLLCRHSDTALRQGAIKTVRGWVGASGPFESAVLASAHESIKRLTVQAQTAGDDDPARETNGEMKAVVSREEDQDDADRVKDIEDASPPNRDPVQDWSFPLENEQQVLQMVELPFVLSIKVPELLDSVFNAYPLMPAAVQEGVQQHIAVLVRSLGPSNPKLLSLLKTFPKGADTLALSIFNVMAEKGRTQALITAVKGLALERDVDAHFLIPILPNLNKAEILKLLPKAVTILNSKSPDDRELLKGLFASIVTRPPQGFGSVSTNLPRVRDSEMLTPVELMGLLHSAEMEIGLKATVDAIRICFSMTDVFRSEVLAAALNQLVEEPELPVLFMRTAIMAVSTYKSLGGYVSSNLLSRLIVKKVWQNKLLWDGFVLCAEQTAPGSFAALLQLPQEQLLDVVKRKPALKEGLRSHLEKKVGNQTRLTAYLELLDGAGAGVGQQRSADSAASTPQTHVSTPPPAPISSSN
ncbi:unnamed protein product [Parajaminaea phylloscopi]